VSNPYAPPDDRPRGDEAPADRGAADGQHGVTGPGHGPSSGPFHGPLDGQAPAPWPGVRPADRPGVGQGPGQQEVPPPVNPAQLSRIAAGMRFGAALVLAALLVQLLPLPWGLLALPFALLGTGVVGRTMLLMSRARVRGPASVLTTLLLVVGVGSVAVSLMLAAYWAAGADSYRCEQSALTVQAHYSCAALLPQQGSMHLP